jgi:hypothetical protein
MARDLLFYVAMRHATEITTEATMMNRPRCPQHPQARINDFGGAYVLCAVCSQQILKGAKSACVSYHERIELIHKEA